MRVLFLIVSSRMQPYARIQHKGQEKTWIKSISNFENVTYKFLVSEGGIPPRNFQLNELHTMPFSSEPIPSALNPISSTSGNILTVNSSLGWESILTNTLAGFRWSLNQKAKFDFVIRTNISSYWDIQNTLDLLKTLPQSKLYAGHKLNKLGTNFIAGDGIILSRDVIKLICDCVSEIDSGVVDDVAIGRFLDKFKITPMHIPRPIVQTLFDCQTIAINQNRIHQVRCKVERKIFNRVFRLDPLLMKSLHANLRKFRVLQNL